LVDQGTNCVAVAVVQDSNNICYGHCLIPDGWLSRAELTDDETLLTLHYPVGTVSIRGHELKPLFDDAVAGVLGEVRECGGPPRANGLWVTLFTWNFVTPEAA
jgi:hypothetical protein